MKNNNGKIKDKPPKQKRTPNKNKTTTPKKQPSPSISERNKVNDTPNNKQRYTDQWYQWKWGQLFPQWAIVIISIIGLSGAIITLMILGSTLKITKSSLELNQSLISLNEEALKITQKQFDLSIEELHRSHRPWVSISGDIGVKKPLTFDNDGCNLTISPFFIKNSGSSPAINVLVTVGLKILPNSFNLDILVFNPPCAKDGFDITGFGGYLLLPGEERQWPGGEEKVVKSSIPDNEKISVWLRVCIEYRDEFSVIHKTPLLYTYKATNKKAFGQHGVVDGYFAEYPFRGQNPT